MSGRVGERCRGWNSGWSPGGDARHKESWRGLGGGLAWGRSMAAAAVASSLMSVVAECRASPQT